MEPSLSSSATASRSDAPTSPTRAASAPSDIFIALSTSLRSSSIVAFVQF